MYLTRRQREMVDCIDKFIRENGYSPTLDEIGRAMGLSSLATVHKHLQNLEAKGMILRNWYHSRSIELTDEAMRGRPSADVNTLPLLGEVAAGLPIEAIENTEPIHVPREFVGRGQDNFVLRVRGNSMIDDGIRDGDLIIVESRSRAEPGQTVVALVTGGEATVKRYYQDGDTVVLKPANELMAPMRFPAAQVHLQGIVIGLMRSYK